MWGFPAGVSGEELANAGDIRDVGLIPGLGRSRGGHGDCSSTLAWRIPVDRGAWQAAVRVVTESDMTGATYHACRHGFEVRQEK